MTDEQMDARLRAAGERFRAATAFDEAVPEVAGRPHDVTGTTRARRSANRRWGLIASAAAVAAALVVGGTLAVQNLTGNNATPTGTTAPLEGTVWQLLGYGRERNPNSSATFYFGADGQLVADDDCTVITADATASASHLSATHLQVRPRSCVDSNAPTFTTGVDILTARPTYSIDGDALTVSDGHTAMHLKSIAGAVPPTGDVPTLTDTRWRMAEAIGPNGDVTIGRGESFTITDGRLEASDGCNTITADAAQDGNRFALTNVQSTRLPCPSNGVDPLIDAVLSKGSIEQVVQGGVLTMTRKGAGTLMFAWTPADAKATNPDALTGPIWRLSGVAGHPAIGGATLIVTRQGRYDLDDGCSQSDGRVDVEHGTIKLTEVPKRPSCGGAVGAQATTIDSYLSVRTLWSVRGGDLVVDGGSAQANSLVFTNSVPAPVARPNSLTGTTWQLTGATSGTAPLRLAPNDAELRLGFVNSGKIDYDDGVNDAEGPVTIGPHTLRIGGLIISAVGCTHSAVCTQAGVIDRVLSGTTSWSISGDRLTVTKAGAGQLVYRLTSSPSDSTAAPDPTAGTDPTVLYGRTWNLESLEHDTANSSSGHAALTSASVRFDGAGNLTLVTYCSTQTEPVVFDSDHAVLSRSTSGHGACLTPLNGRTAERAAIISVFAPGEVAWSVDGNTLAIKRGDDTLTFRSS
jgi:heat shock protein HslJ